MKNQKEKNFINSKFKALFFQKTDLQEITKDILNLYKTDPDEFIDNIENINFFLDMCLNLYFSKLKDNKDNFHFHNKKLMKLNEKEKMVEFLKVNLKTHSNNISSHFLKTTFGMFKKTILKNLFTLQKDYFDYPLFFKILLIPDFNPFTKGIIENNKFDNHFREEINSRRGLNAKEFVTNNEHKISFFNNLFAINPDIYIEMSKNNQFFNLLDNQNQSPLFYLQSFKNIFFNRLDLDFFEQKKNKMGETFIEYIISNGIDSGNEYFYMTIIKNLQKMKFIDLPDYQHHNTLLNSLKATLLVNNSFINKYDFSSFYNNIDKNNLVFIPLRGIELLRPLKIFTEIHPLQLFQKWHNETYDFMDIITRQNTQEIYSKDVLGYLFQNEWPGRRNCCELLKTKTEEKNTKISDDRIIEIFEEGIAHQNLTGLYTLELIYGRNPKLDMQLSILNKEQKISAMDAYFKVFSKIELLPEYFFKNQFYLASAFNKMLQDENIYNSILWNMEKVKGLINFYNIIDDNFEIKDNIINKELFKHIKKSERIDLLANFLYNSNIHKTTLKIQLENIFLQEKLISNPQYNEIKQKKRI